MIHIIVSRSYTSIVTACVRTASGQKEYNNNKRATTNRQCSILLQYARQMRLTTKDLILNFEHHGCSFIPLISLRLCELEKWQFENLRFTTIAQVNEVPHQIMYAYDIYETAGDVTHCNCMLYAYIICDEDLWLRNKWNYMVFEL